MAPQTSIPVAANILGTIGTVLWCVQLIPQVWHNWRNKKTDGLPALMMFLWAACAVPFGVYAVVQNFNIPIQIQPQVFGSLALVNWAQILIYNKQWKTWKAVAAAASLFILFGTIEAVLIVTLRGPYDQGVAWPMMLIGVIAAVLVAGGLIPPYFEMWVRRGRVVGINWLFLSMDCAGAVFSLFALVAQNTFDVLGGIIYLSVIVLEVGIFSSHVIWLLRTRTLRKKAKDQGVKFDDLPEARKYQGQEGQNTQSEVSDLSKPASSELKESRLSGELAVELGSSRLALSEYVLGIDILKDLDSWSISVPGCTTEKDVERGPCAAGYGSMAG